MHIPDGYLSPTTCAVLGAVMVPVWYKSVSHLKRTLHANRVPKLAMASVFSFLIMMFNVPVPDGTTAHAIGATLIAILFGPWAAVIGMSVALAIQALVFADGGILAFGANCFNMGFVASFVGYGIFKMFGGYSIPEKSAKQLLVAGFAAYCGINAAALCTGIELGIQPLFFTAANGAPLYAAYPLSVSIPAMLIPHLTLIGLVEAVVTMGALRFVESVEPLHPYDVIEGGQL